MRKFSIRLSIFIAGMMLLVIPLSWLADHIIVDENLSELNEKQPNLLLLGDSHARALGQKVHGDGVYDFSYDSDSYFDIYGKLRYCLDNGIRPEAVLLECDWHMFSEYRFETNSERRTVRLIGFSTYVDLFDADWSDFVLNRYIYPPFKALDVNNVPLLRDWLKSRLVGLFTEVAPKPVWSELTESERRRRALGRFHTQLDQPCEVRLETAFRAIIALCRTHQIEVIGIRFPLSPEYNDLLVNADLKCVEQIYISSKIRIIEVAIALDQPEYFKDQDHLSELGVELWRAALIDELDHCQLTQFSELF